MTKKEKTPGNESEKMEEINSSDIENAHASGDGALGRDEETLISKTKEEKQNAAKKDAEQY